MADSNLARLLAFARHLQPLTSLTDLLSLARKETREVVGYDRVWFMVADEKDPDELRLVEFSGNESTSVWDVAATLRADQDPFIAAVLRSDEPVVVEDARTDPRTDKRIVEYLQNRTIIKVPIRVVDRPWGLIGMGTFGEEGCRPPSPEQLSYLAGMAGQLAVAISRLRFVEAEQRVAAERLDLQGRLQRVQKLESLGTLAGGIAHDFNNLLTVITAGATLAEKDTTDENVRDNILAILAAAERGTALTRQLLAMSRAQALDLKRLDLNHQLTELIALARRVFPATMQLAFEAGAGLPSVEGDPSQLDQVFMNLFINARDAMSNGGRLIIETMPARIEQDFAELHPWAKPGDYVLTTVTDTGAGMSKAVLDRIFEPFFSTKTARAGTGLGLAVAYGIVQQHGGLLNVYSEPGVGTTFNVYFPAAVGARASAQSFPPSAVPKAAGGHERVLLADDDELVRQMALRVMQRAGYQVTAVANGIAACEAARAQTFDLALLDVVMPGLPCDDLLDQLKVIAPSLRVLLSSGYAAGLNISELCKRTDNELLRKPYSPEQLLRAARIALDRREADI